MSQRLIVYCKSNPPQAEEAQRKRVRIGRMSCASHRSSIWRREFLPDSRREERSVQAYSSDEQQRSWPKFARPSGSEKLADFCVAPPRSTAEGTPSSSRREVSTVCSLPNLMTYVKYKTQQYVIDPKPEELALARVNLREIEGEARTGWLFKTFG